MFGMDRKSPIRWIVVTNAPPAVADDIRGIKAPVAIPSSWTWLWWTLAALALLGLLWWAWQRWRRKKTAAAEATVYVAPDERALQKLREALALMHEPRSFCIAVSDAVRLYMEERFSLRAPERTTEEFLEELQGSALLALEHKRILGEFLSRCDLVKFARYEPTETELRAIYDAAVRLVQETRPAPLLPPAAEPADTVASEAKSP